MTMHNPRRRDSVQLHQTTDGFILYDVASGQIHLLNPTAHFVWNHLDGYHTIEEIGRAIRKEFDVPHDVAVETDVLSIVFVFRDLNLLNGGAA